MNTFFNLVFGPSTGLVCIAVGRPGKFDEAFFQYPDEKNSMFSYVESRRGDGNVYFCPQLFTKKRRTKENVKYCPNLWADLDACPPDKMLVAPTVTLVTSPKRYQAVWVLDEPVAAEVAEQLCKNIAYAHVDDGADTSGWDLTQLLRVPTTANIKYSSVPEIEVANIVRRTYDVGEFGEYEEVRVSAYEEDPMPSVLPTESATDIMQRYRRTINPICFGLFSTEPVEDWSKQMWNLISLLFEAGLSREEVFVVASAAACNKYKRDNKHPRLLWREVCRGHAHMNEKFDVVAPTNKSYSSLITEDELRMIEGRETFVERYIDWASGIGDAATQYHQAGAFMALSAILSGNISLPTSFGTIKPNLWFMILADTTLTRKSTAMDAAMDLVSEVDPDVLLATDGSLEGLMQILQGRPGRPSVFLRDEFSGLIEAMTKKDYMAGMAETLTKLYDGKTAKRVLKRETVAVVDPILLVFGGGIKTRVQSLLTLDHVSSGFIPRFVFITAESDVSRVQPLGPPTMAMVGERAALQEELRQMQGRYGGTQKSLVRTADGREITVQVPAKWEAFLTPEAWHRYNVLESTMLTEGVHSDMPDVMTPVYDRLSKSILKAAVLLAASEMPETPQIEVTIEHILQAIKYGTQWREYAHEVINGIGRSMSEGELTRILESIRRNPGVTRSTLMRWYHLESRRADIIFATLEQRMLIQPTKLGKTTAYSVIGRKQPSE